VSPHTYFIPRREYAVAPASAKQAIRRCSTRNMLVIPWRFPDSSTWSRPDLCAHGEVAWGTTDAG